MNGGLPGNNLDRSFERTTGRIQNRSEGNVALVGLPPAGFTTSAGIQGEFSLVDNHGDGDEIGDSAKWAGHGDSFDETLQRVFIASTGPHGNLREKLILF